MEPGALPEPTKLNPVKGSDGVWRLTRVRHRAFNGTYVRTSGSGRTRKECLADWHERFERNRRKGSAGNGGDRQVLKLTDKMTVALDAYYAQQEKKLAAGKITEQSLTTTHRAIYKGEGLNSKPDALKLARTLGRLSIGEAGTPAFLADYLDGLAKEWPGVAGHHWTVLSGVFKMLTLAGLFQYSPMLQVPRPESGGGSQRALTADEREELCPIIGGRQKRAKYLLPLVLLMLGTGVRPGEALAVRRCDLRGLDDDGVENITLHVCGTMVARKGAYVRQPYRKSAKKSKVSNDFYVVLPRWLTSVLRLWVKERGDISEEGALFISLLGGVVRLSTADDALRNARVGTSLEWMQFGNLRDTVATHVKGVTGDSKRASAQLGHSEGASMAMRHYIDEDGYVHPAVDNSDALESLCPRNLGARLESGADVWVWECP
ncbi:tyrosine-type recombinase/integrase [Nocardia niwae]|uniref:tyrosine-type recombinase/integrase n=1 Tax=Nocardia niwae TaxID=626084 RepID=UPI000A0531DF|nr:tyrosine-type recombinase/integrase [Nocardia niwae]